MAYVNFLQHLEIFSELRVMAGKLQNANSRASLRFQKIFPDTVIS